MLVHIVGATLSLGRFMTVINHDEGKVKSDED
jgi:hypothetical protein